jgi:hypothetical protein
VRALRLARRAWQQGRIPLPPLVRSLGPDLLGRTFARLQADAGAGSEFLRTCQRTFKESRAGLARVRRGAYAVLVSSAVLAPIVIASISVAGRHLHSDHRLWLLAIALAAFSALALIAAALFAVRSLALSGSAAPMSLPAGPQKTHRGGTNLVNDGEVLLKRAQENRRRAVQGIGPLVVARRSLAIATLTLVLAGALVLVATAL